MPKVHASAIAGLIRSNRDCILTIHIHRKKKNRVALGCSPAAPCDPRVSQFRHYRRVYVLVVSCESGLTPENAVTVRSCKVKEPVMEGAAEAIHDREERKGVSLRVLSLG